MSKVQAYLYIAVIALALVAVAVFWNARKVDQQPAVNSQPSNSAPPEVSIKYNSDGSIDTSDWLTFRHEVYPYEIRYPKERQVYLFTTYREDNTENKDGKGINIAGVDVEGDVAGAARKVDDNFNLKAYAEEMRERVLEPGVAPLMTHITEIEMAKSAGWQGYQFSVTEKLGDRRDDVGTSLHILHNGKLYRVLYNDTDPLESAIVNTLLFLD